MTRQPIRVEVLALVPTGSTLTISISHQHDLANGERCERDPCNVHRCALCAMVMGPLLDERSQTLANRMLEGVRR